MNLDGTLLWHAVERWAREWPDAEALVFNDERLSWRDFQREVDLAAKAFLALGVERGDRIAMVSMGRNEFMIAFMAAAKIGAIWLGLSPKFTVDELRYVLGHCRPTLVITLRDYLGIDLVETGFTFKEEFSSIHEVLVIGEEVEDAVSFGAFVHRERPELDEALRLRASEVSAKDEVLLMYTSGSTGRPKGVLHTHEGIVKNVAAEVLHLDFQPGTRSLLHFPINHVAADVEIGYATVYCGGTLVFMDRFDPQQSLDMIVRERIEVIGQVPVMYLLQFQTPEFAEIDWRHVKLFVWGGSTPPPILLDVLGPIAARTGARLMTGYGSTELCGFVTYSDPADDRELLAKSAGRIVAPFELKIVGLQREELADGEVGEIAVRGPSVMDGYLNNPVATAEVVDSDGWYYTSDLGSKDEDGYLFISGRKSEMFKAGGENVYPREIENVLESHPAVLFAAVLGVPDPIYDEVGHAVIMLKPGQAATEEELRGYCKARLANFKVPKSFDLREQLPLLPNGKVNKVLLKQELTARP